MAQPNSLIVCPTSHMDWDWLVSFEEYYKTEFFSPQVGTQGPVQCILDAACRLLASENSFFFSVAELGWLQRYLVDAGGTLADAPGVAQALCLMGGAITSPDNLVCDGEVFVRAYLVGRQWARSVGLGAAVADVAWLPDDFGHDPELPVILSAMGLSAVGFARVPGSFPLYNAPCDQTEESVACTLMAQGVAFHWQASDASSVFAHFMPFMYGVPFTSNSPQYNQEYWEGFVGSTFLTENYPCSSLPGGVVWPGGISFAPAGGDFSVPNPGWVEGVGLFNQKSSGTTAEVGTFPQYVAAVMGSGAVLKTIPLDPSNFYTGYFGSRPELKTLQASASRDLVAAEMASSLLRLGSGASDSALDALDGAIGQVWAVLAPSSHHDFVTGTSPDAVYKTEQLPMLSIAARMASAAYGEAVQILADALATSRRRNARGRPQPGRRRAGRRLRDPGWIGRALRKGPTGDRAAPRRRGPPRPGARRAGPGLRVRVRDDGDAATAGRGGGRRRRGDDRQRHPRDHDRRGANSGRSRPSCRPEAPIC